MTLPSRKPNRLPDFDYSTPGAYFITICTKDRKNLLGRIVGGGALDAPQVHLSNIGLTVDKYIQSSKKLPGIRVDIYTIMPNHIHLMLFVEPTAASGSSKTLTPTNSAIAHYVSTLKRFCHREIGFPIFRRSYHDHIVRGDKDYLKIWTYINSNPSKWEADCFYQRD